MYNSGFKKNWGLPASSMNVWGADDTSIHIYIEVASLRGSDMVLYALKKVELRSWEPLGDTIRQASNGSAIKQTKKTSQLVESRWP